MPSHKVALLKKMHVEMRLHISRKVLQTSFNDWKKYIHFRKSNSLDAQLCLKRAVRLAFNATPVWTSERVMTIFYMWQRFAVFRRCRRHGITVPEFHHQLPIWDIWVVKYQEKQLRLLKAEAKYPLIQTKRYFKRMKAFTLCCKVKRQFLTIAAKHYPKLLQTKCFIGWKQVTVSKREQRIKKFFAFRSWKTFAFQRLKLRKTKQQVQILSRTALCERTWKTWGRVYLRVAMSKYYKISRILEFGTEARLTTVVHAWSGQQPQFNVWRIIRSWNAVSRRRRLWSELKFYGSQCVRVHETAKCFFAWRIYRRSNKLVQSLPSLITTQQHFDSEMKLKLTVLGDGGASAVYRSPNSSSILSAAIDADAKAQNRKMTTPLHQFILNRNTDEMRKHLLDNRASVHVKDICGDSPLHCAVRLHLTPGGDQGLSFRMIIYLLECGADPSLKNDVGESVTDIAQSDLQIMYLLENSHEVRLKNRYTQYCYKPYVKFRKENDQWGDLDSGSMWRFAASLLCEINCSRRREATELGISNSFTLDPSSSLQRLELMTPNTERKYRILQRQAFKYCFARRLFTLEDLRNEDQNLEAIIGKKILRRQTLMKRDMHLMGVHEKGRKNAGINFQLALKKAEEKESFRVPVVETDQIKVQQLITFIRQRTPLSSVDVDAEAERLGHLCAMYESRILSHHKLLETLKASTSTRAAVEEDNMKLKKELVENELKLYQFAKPCRDLMDATALKRELMYVIEWEERQIEVHARMHDRIVDEHQEVMIDRENAKDNGVHDLDYFIDKCAAAEVKVIQLHQSEQQRSSWKEIHERTLWLLSQIETGDFLRRLDQNEIPMEELIKKRKHLKEMTLLGIEKEANIANLAQGQGLLTAKIELEHFEHSLQAMARLHLAICRLADDLMGQDEPTSEPIEQKERSKKPIEQKPYMDRKAQRLLEVEEGLKALRQKEILKKEKNRMKQKYIDSTQHIFKDARINRKNREALEADMRRKAEETFMEINPLTGKLEGAPAHLRRSSMAAESKIKIKTSERRSSMIEKPLQVNRKKKQLERDRKKKRRKRRPAVVEESTDEDVESSEKSDDEGRVHGVYFEFGNFTAQPRMDDDDAIPNEDIPLTDPPFLENQIESMWKGMGTVASYSVRHGQIKRAKKPRRAFARAPQLPTEVSKPIVSEPKPAEDEKPVEEENPIVDIPLPEPTIDAVTPQIEVVTKRLEPGDAEEYLHELVQPIPDRDFDELVEHDDYDPESMMAYIQSLSTLDEASHLPIEEIEEQTPSSSYITLSDYQEQEPVPVQVETPDSAEEERLVAQQKAHWKSFDKLVQVDNTLRGYGAVKSYPRIRRGLTANPGIRTEPVNNNSTALYIAETDPDERPVHVRREVTKLGALSKKVRPRKSASVSSLELRGGSVIPPVRQKRDKQSSEIEYPPPNLRAEENLESESLSLMGSKLLTKQVSLRKSQSMIIPELRETPREVSRAVEDAYAELGKAVARQSDHEEVSNRSGPDPRDVACWMDIEGYKSIKPMDILLSPKMSRGAIEHKTFRQRRVKASEIYSKYLATSSEYFLPWMIEYPRILYDIREYIPTAPSALFDDLQSIIHLRISRQKQ